MTEDLPTHLARYQAALEDGDLQRASEAAIAVERTDAGPVALLESLEATLERDDRQTAQSLLWLLRRAYERREAVETREMERARLAYEAGTTDPITRRDVSMHTEEGSRVTEARAHLFAEAISYLTPGEETQTAAARESLLAVTRRVLEREKTVASTRKRVTGYVDEMDLPAAPRITSAGTNAEAILAGESGTLTVTVANVGDEPTAAVTLSVDAPDAVSLSTSEIDLGQIDGRATRTESVTVTGGETGRHTAAVALRHDGQPSGDATVTVEVTETPVSPLSAFDENDDGRIDTDEIQAAVVHYREGTPVEDYGGATLTAEDLRRLLVAWATDERV